MAQRRERYFSTEFCVWRVSQEQVACWPAGHPMSVKPTPSVPATTPTTLAASTLQGTAIPTLHYTLILKSYWLNILLFY